MICLSKATHHGKCGRVVRRHEMEDGRGKIEAAREKTEGKIEEGR